MNRKKILSLLLAGVMTLSLVACGGNSGNNSGNSGDSGTSSTGDTEAVKQASAGDTDNGDGSFTNTELGYTYGTKFYSDEPVTYTMFFNDNDAYPITDEWQEEGGIFYEIEQATNVHLDITIVNNASYNDKVSLAVSTGETPYIIPKIYSENAYVNGGGIVPVSDYTQYMPNFTNFYNDYDMEADLGSIRQDDGKFYRLPGMKETSLQDYTLLIRKDIFDAAGYDVTELEKDWTWPEFAEVLKGVKEYMVSQGMCSENDYIWSDRWCGATSGYGTGGCLLNVMSHNYGIYTTWSGSSATNMADLYFDWDADEFKVSSTSQRYKDYMTVIQDLVSSKILDPETWSQEDSAADSDFYTGKTVLILTNRATTTSQDEGVAAQLGAGNYELYRIVMPQGVDEDGNPISYQAENSRLECGVMIASKALNELGEDEFIKMMRFVDWLWYSEAGLTLTKWGIEGETYQIVDGSYELMPQYYCGGLSIAQTSDDQEDLRIKYGFACGNFMYGGSRELLTSNFSADLRDFYDRMAEYRTLMPLDPHIALSEDDSEMCNLWATPLFSEMNTWTCRFAMGQADIEADWDTYVASIEAQNVQSVLDMFNSYYQASK